MENENITFLELYEKTKKKIIITGTCINNKCIDYFSYETTPSMKIIDAIRITMSIPLIYNKINLCINCYNITCNCDNSDKKIYVDGAVLENYPIHLFKNSKHCLGFILTNDKKNDKIEDISDYILHLLSCMRNKLLMYQIKDFEDVTVSIPIDINGLNFSLTEKDKINLINSGYKYTSEYLQKKQNEETESEEETDGEETEDEETDGEETDGEETEDEETEDEEETDGEETEDNS